MAKPANRGIIIGVVVVAVIVALGIAFWPKPSAKIVISNWDGYMPADLLENFTKETGIEAELSVHATNEEIMGKVTAGGGKGYDVLFVSGPFVEALANLGLIAELDQGKLPHLANPPPHP